MLKKKRFFNSLISFMLFLILYGFLSLSAFILSNQEWVQASGYEFEWIAGSLASGHGYSFDKGSAWLGPYDTPGEFVPTAWSEPIQTIIIAFSFRALGENGRLFLVLLNILWLSLANFPIFLIGKRLLGRLTGFMSVVLFLIVVILHSTQIFYIGNTALASFLIALSALALINVLDDFSIQKMILLGLIFGLTNLTHTGSLLFPLLAAFIILILGVKRNDSTVKNVSILLVTVVITVSPWMFRNLIVFDRIIPVRNGFGWQLYLGNLGLSAVAGYDMEAHFAGPDFPRQAESPRHAVAFFKSLENEAQVREYLMTEISTQYPAAYSSYNETERDRFFLHQSFAFLQAHPLRSIIFMFWKGFTFFTWDTLTLLITVLAIGGWLLRFRDLRVQILMFLILAYSLPYILSIPLYYRYCFPIQPLLAILAAISIRFLLCLTSVGRNFDKFFDSIATGVSPIL